MDHQLSIHHTKHHKGNYLQSQVRATMAANAGI